MRMTRARIVKILSCASCRSSYSTYLSQNGCARKSRPTNDAPRSNSLKSHISKYLTARGSRVGVGAEGKYTKGNDHVRGNNPVIGLRRDRMRTMREAVNGFQVSCHGFWQRVREHPNRAGLPKAYLTSRQCCLDHVKLSRVGRPLVVRPSGRRCVE